MSFVYLVDHSIIVLTGHSHIPLIEHSMSETGSALLGAAFGNVSNVFLCVCVGVFSPGSRTMAALGFFASTR